MTDLSRDEISDLSGQALNAINEEFMRQNELGLAQSATKSISTASAPCLNECIECRLRSQAASLVSTCVRRCVHWASFRYWTGTQPGRRYCFIPSVAEAPDAKYGRRICVRRRGPPSYARPRTGNSQRFLLAIEGTVQEHRAEPATRLTKLSQLRITSSPTPLRDFASTTSYFASSTIVALSAAPNWPWYGSGVAPGNPLQQLVSFALVPARPDNRAAVEKHKAILDLAFRNALGAFLSSAGVSAEENSILIAQRVAAHSLLRAHEIANETQKSHIPGYQAEPCQAA